MKSFILAVLFVTVTQAALVKWTCSSGEEFSTANCWDSKTVPGANDDALITNGPPMTVSQAVTVNSISYNTALNGLLTLNAVVTAKNIYVGSPQAGGGPSVTFGTAFSSPNVNFTLGQAATLIPTASTVLSSLYVLSGASIDVSKKGAAVITTKQAFVQGGSSIKVDAFSNPADSLTWKSASWTLNGPLDTAGLLTLTADSGSNDIYFVQIGDKAPSITGMGSLALGANTVTHITNPITLATKVALTGKLAFSRTSAVRPSLALGASGLTTLAGSSIDITSTYIDPTQADNQWQVVDASVTETVKPIANIVLPNKCSPASLVAGSSRGYALLLQPYAGYKGPADFTIKRSGLASIDFGITANTNDPCVVSNTTYTIYTSFIVAFSTTHLADGAQFTITGSPIPDKSQSYSIDTRTTDINFMRLTSTTDDKKKTYDIAQDPNPTPTGNGGSTNTKADPTRPPPTSDNSGVKVAVVGAAFVAALLF